VRALSYRWILSAVVLSACAAAESSPPRAASAVNTVEPAAAPSSVRSTCARHRPTACIEPAPSYASDVAPLLERRCGSCHENGGPETDDHDFSRFETLHAQRTSVLAEVSTCAMPPSDAPPLSPAEAELLLHWAACGAPRN